MNWLLKTIFVLVLAFALPFLGHSQTQTIRGTVVDGESTMPIIGAAVIVVDSDPLIGATTDLDGKFNLPNVKVGRVDLKVTYLGYAPRTLSGIELFSGKELVLNVDMQEMVMKQDEVVVKASRRKEEVLNTMATVSARVFSTEEASRYAGTRNDVSRMATNFAGVRGANDATNDIVIRGNSPTGLLWRFEDIDIPNPNHFGNLGSTGGPVSMLNSNVLANSDFLTGAFPSDYGNGLSGVFDLKMRSGNNEKHEFLGQIGFNGLELGAEGPFSKKSGASYLINFRYSTLALFQLGGVDFGTGDATPQYTDLSFKVRIPTKKAGIFEAFGMGGISSIEFIASEQEAGGTNFYTQGNIDVYDRTKTGVFGFSHTYLFKNASYLKMTVAASTQINQDIVDSVDATTRNPFDWYKQNFQDHRFQGSIFYKKKFNAKHSLKVGTRTTVFYSVLQDSAFIPSWNDYETLTDFDGVTALIQPYAQWQWRWSDSWTMNTGLHGQVLTLNGSYAIEPRWGLQWKVNPRHKISLAYGLHSQMVALDQYFLVMEDSLGNRETPNKDLDFVRSHHVVLGYDWGLPFDMRIKLEAYYQYIYNAGIDSDSSSFSTLNIGSFTQDGPDNIINGGTGTNYGLELTFEKFLSNGYYWLLTASLYDSKYAGSDGVQRNTVFNGNYVLNVLGGYELNLKKKNPKEKIVPARIALKEKRLTRWNKKQERKKATSLSLKFDVKFTLAGGSRYTPIDLEASSIAKRAVYEDELAYSEQFEPYYRLDLGLTFRMSRKRVTQEFSASCQNVTDKANPLYNQYDPETNSLVNVNQLGVYPLLQYKILF
ncbi:TonB-dependent receptor [Flavobacteriales bacterium]|nr:TonB-dependent receptor [Flavobacteriales bacterium]